MYMLTHTQQVVYFEFKTVKLQLELFSIDYLVVVLIKHVIQKNKLKSSFKMKNKMIKDLK